jgi:hypothetical protein
VNRNSPKTWKSSVNSFFADDDLCTKFAEFYNHIFLLLFYLRSFKRAAQLASLKLPLDLPEVKNYVNFEHSVFPLEKVNSWKESFFHGSNTKN